MASNKSTFHPIDFSEDIMIKVQLGDDIRLVFIHNESITYDELLLAIKRIFNGKLTATDDLTIKLKDEDGDMVTVFDSKSLLYALLTNRVLKLQVFMNNLKNQEPLKSTLKANKELLLGIKDTVGGCVLDTFEVTDEGNNSNTSNPIKQEPVNIASPKIPTYNIHTNELDLLGNSNEECSKTSQQVNIYTFEVTDEGNNSNTSNPIKQEPVNIASPKIPTYNIHTNELDLLGNSNEECSKTSQQVNILFKISDEENHNNDDDDDDDKENENKQEVETTAVATDTETSCSSNDDDVDADPCGEVISDDDASSVQTNESCEDDVAFRYHCAKCDLSFKFNCWFKRHMSTHTPGTFACKYCPKFFKRKDTLREHQYIHFGGLKHKCKECSKEFGDKRNLNAHVKLIHNNASIKCPKCEKFYSGKRQLRYHDNRVHTLLTPYKCKMCNEAFPVPRMLAAHRNKMKH